jgi:hypothetical protein
MKSDLSTTFASTSPDKRHERETCLFKAERVLDCGSIVNERHGRIIAKTSILPQP